ncbi:MAG: aminotransferase class III-fold pyridoxal phosphate-dependent enzyme, partial [Ginsengibacter sp.]
GNLVDMVRSSKILEIMTEDNLCANATETGSYLQQKLKAIAQKDNRIENVRGLGLLTAFDFPTADLRNNFLKKGMEQNVLFLGCGMRSIRFRPALIIENQHIDEGLSVMEKILGEI